MATIRRILKGARHGLFVLPAITALLLYKLLPAYPHFTEKVITGGVFRFISVPLGWVVSWIPFSLTELLAVCAAPAVILGLVLLIRRIIKNSGRRLAIIARAGKVAGWVLSSSLLMYMLMHGANFYRLPAAELLGLDPPPMETEILYSLCADLATLASAERETLAEDENGYMILRDGSDTALRVAGEGYRVLDDKFPVLWGGVNRAKPVRLSHFWSYTGIAGMYFPLLGESNVNIDQPDSFIPSTAAHELAHTRGFAREDECNFFAILSCLEHPSAEYRYSGYLMAFIHCSNELYRVDKDLWAEARSKCSDKVNADLRQHSEYWKQFEGPVRAGSEKVNDSFIQSQGVSDGTRSYSRVTSLLVSWYSQTTCKS